jgi:hypothetical protein
VAQLDAYGEQPGRLPGRARGRRGARLRLGHTRLLGARWSVQGHAHPLLADERHGVLERGPGDVQRRPSAHAGRDDAERLLSGKPTASLPSATGSSPIASRSAGASRSRRGSPLTASASCRPRSPHAVSRA